MDKSVVDSFFDRWGNTASVLGFSISLISLAIALWSFFRVRAVAGRTVGRIGSHLLSVEIMSLSSLITEVLDAERDKQWLRAIERSRQARHAFLRLWQNPQLMEEEQTKLATAADDLRMLINYIEENRMPPDAPAESLPARQRRILDMMVTTLGGIQGRLQNLAMEV